MKPLLEKDDPCLKSAFASHCFCIAAGQKLGHCGFLLRYGKERRKKNCSSGALSGWGSRSLLHFNQVRRVPSQKTGKGAVPELCKHECL